MSITKNLLLVLIVLVSGCIKQEESPILGSLGFENCSAGDLSEYSEGGIKISAAKDHIRIYPKKGKTSPNSLHLVGGEESSVEISNVSGEKAKYIGFSAERWTSKPPFRFRVEAYENGNWKEIYNGDKQIKTGYFPADVLLTLPDSEEQKVRLKATAAQSGGVLIDDVVFFSDADMVIDSVVVPHHVYPVLKEKKENPVLNIQVYAAGFSNAQKLDEVTIHCLNFKQLKGVRSVKLLYTGKNTRLDRPVAYGEEQEISEQMVFKSKQDLVHGINNLFVLLELDESASINQDILFECSAVKIDGKKQLVKNSSSVAVNRLGIAIRQHNDEGVDTYRIPGLATTNKGTLIGVYDMRWNSGTDLQEDVDVGMSRSIDGGETWEPMKVIMDMKEWGGLPNDQNGIGDPSVLVDRETNTIWVAGVWAHGHPDKRNWWASQPGIKPEKTSQFVLVKSEDDGITWSEPINITSQIKEKDWYLLLQGPGKGITLKDGTLVFPAQFKDKDQMPHSTLIWSKDHGKTWNIGTGAKANTTEAQVIELDNGDLMLNMRDNRNRTDASESNGRSVYITSDLGNTWTKHATSRTNILKESTCQASIIKEEFDVNGEMKNIVIFSNPNTMTGRHHMTLKLSMDDGETWPEKYNRLIDSGSGRGYSCLTKIDNKHFGILYEGSQSDLIFQKFSIDEILKP